jgi:hypothetical protein
LRPEVRWFLTSSARLEELVEQITEPRLEYVHLKRSRPRRARNEPI